MKILEYLSNFWERVYGSYRLARGIVVGILKRAKRGCLRLNFNRLVGVKFTKIFMKKSLFISEFLLLLHHQKFTNN